MTNILRPVEYNFQVSFWASSLLGAFVLTLLCCYDCVWYGPEILQRSERMEEYFRSKIFLLLYLTECNLLQRIDITQYGIVSSKSSGLIVASNPIVSWISYFPAFLGYYYRPTGLRFNQPTNQQTDRMVHREVSKIVFSLILIISPLSFTNKSIFIYVPYYKLICKCCWP